VKLALAWSAAVNRLLLAVATMGLVVALFFSGVPILDQIELRTYDLRFLSRGTRRPRPPW
jgi:hypothetical protein